MSDLLFEEIRALKGSGQPWLDDRQYVHPTDPHRPQSRITGRVVAHSVGWARLLSVSLTLPA